MGASHSMDKTEMPKLRDGVGAKVSILTRFIHPSEHVRSKHPNLEKQHRTEGVLIGRGEKTVTRRVQECYTFRSGDYEVMSCMQSNAT